MNHILVVDDDERLRELLKRYLMKQGYWVSTSNDAAKACHLLKSFEFDLLVVDVMMPGEDGVSFVKRIRAENNVPILMLTAKSEVNDRLDGFEAGIDDFLAKPFEPRELAMRIEAILRRSRPVEEGGGVIVFGDYHFDLGSQKLFKGVQKIELTRNERDILKLFCNNMNDTVTREEILSALGDDKNLRNVDVTITRLRKKIEPDPKNAQYIHTVRGEGYKLSPPLEIEKSNTK